MSIHEFAIQAAEGRGTMKKPAKHTAPDWTEMYGVFCISPVGVYWGEPNKGTQSFTAFQMSCLTMSCEEEVSPKC
jgi:hypothetical protein